MTREGSPQDADHEEDVRGDVPAGGAGADSGAGATVGVDADDTAGVQNVSSQNDIAGVGTRGPEGADASVADDSEIEQQARAADPAYVRDDEAAGAAAHNARVSARDAGDAAQRAQVDDAFQHLPRMAQNAPSREEELAGIVAQTQGDLAMGIADERVPDILRQRLSDAGIEFDDAAIDELVRRVLRRG
jgi:hypothetical protein